MFLLRLARISPSFEESHIEGGRVEVDKLEDEHLEDEGVVVLGLCSVHLCNGQNMDTKLKVMILLFSIFFFQISLPNKRFD